MRSYIFQYILGIYNLICTPKLKRFLFFQKAISGICHCQIMAIDLRGHGEYYKK